MTQTKTNLALSSWAVHDWVGETFPSGPGLAAPRGANLGKILQLPQEAKSRLGIDTLEICHFHLVQDKTQLDRLRSACVRSGTKLFQLLIDDGDISHPIERIAYLEWMGGWIEAAAHAGFERVRVSPGRQNATPETVLAAIDSLKMLNDMAKAMKVGLSIENWHELAQDPQTVLAIMEALGKDLGLVVDFGNYVGPDKYERLAKLAPKATSCHAKIDFVNQEPNVEDFRQCQKLMREADFKGNWTLVHPEKADEWGALELQRSLALS